MPRKRYTYEIISAKADYASRSITANCAHSTEPVTAQFTVNHGLVNDPPIVDQMFKAYTLRIQAIGGGNDRQWGTVSENLGRLARFTERLIAAGITDLAEESFTVDACQTHLSPTVSTATHEVVWIAAAMKGTTHPDRESLAADLAALPLKAETKSQVKAYPKRHGEAVRDAAALVVRNCFEQFKADLAALGLDVSGRKVMGVTAQEIVAASKKRSPEVVGWSAPTKQADMDGWSDEQVFDYFVVHGPGAAPACLLNGPLSQRRLIFERVYPGIVEMAGWTVSHCVADLQGFNFASILGVGVDDVAHSGAQVVQVNYGKARSHSTQRIPTSAQGLSTLGGLLQAMHVRTELQRHHAAATGHPAAQKYYLRPVSGKVLNKDAPGKAFKGSTWKAALEEVAPDVTVESLSFRKLRRWCIAEGLQIGPSHKAAMQSDRTFQSYLDGVLTDDQFHELATAAVDEMVDAAGKALSSERRVTLKTGLENQSLVELGHSVCATGQTLPDDADKPCLQGPLACFTCKSGFRTASEIPGVVSLNTLAARLVDERPGDLEAQLLLEATKKTLKAFGKRRVKAHQESLDPVIYSLVANHYAAHRHHQENPNG